MMHSSSGVDVVVVGGGVIGLAVAWQSARRGLSVAVVDDAHVARASWAGAGMLAPVSEVSYGEEALLRLSLRSAEMYPMFVAELEEASGVACKYRQCGSLLVAVDNDDHAVLADLLELQHRLGLSSLMFVRRTAR
jgi:glycine oxidase